MPGNTDSTPDNTNGRPSNKCESEHNDCVPEEYCNIMCTPGADDCSPYDAYRGDVVKPFWSKPRGGDKSQGQKPFRPNYISDTASQTSCVCTNTGKFKTTPPNRAYCKNCKPGVLDYAVNILKPSQTNVPLDTYPSQRKPVDKYEHKPVDKYPSSTKCTYADIKQIPGAINCRTYNANCIGGDVMLLPGSKKCQPGKTANAATSTDLLSMCKCMTSKIEPGNKNKNYAQNITCAPGKTELRFGIK